MITIPAGVRIYVACGITDMRRGFDGLFHRFLNNQFVNMVTPLGPSLTVIITRRGRKYPLP